MITFDFSIRIFKILMQIDDEALKTNFIEKAVDYARIRTDWYFMDIDSKRDKDNGRTKKHNALIESIKSIYNYMKSNDMNVNWYEELPDYRSPSGRKEWGDFACYIHCYIGILQR